MAVHLPAEHGALSHAGARDEDADCQPQRH
jgi:hypothetical protein